MKFSLVFITAFASAALAGPTRREEAAIDQTDANCVAKLCNGLTEGGKVCNSAFTRCTAENNGNSDWNALLKCLSVPEPEDQLSSKACPAAPMKDADDSTGVAEPNAPLSSTNGESLDNTGLGSDGTGPASNPNLAPSRSGNGGSMGITPR